MNLLDLIGWALSIGIAWEILTSFISVESWVSSLIVSVKNRRFIMKPGVIAFR